MSYEQTLSSFMEKHYTSERLAWLLAHAESGALSFWSCCCFIGIPTADHALRGHIEGFLGQRGTHYDLMRRWDVVNESADAEQAYYRLGRTEIERRTKLIPLIQAEFERRQQVSSIESEVGEVVGVTV